MNRSAMVPGLTMVWQTSLWNRRKVTHATGIKYNVVQISTERKVFIDPITKEFLSENGSQNVTAGPVVQDVDY